MSTKSHSYNPASRYLLAFVIALCFSIGLYALPGTEKNRNEQESHYTIVIDAGSSGSRIFIYQVTPGTHDEVPEVSLLESKKVTPGISEYDHNPEQGRKNLKTLLNTAKEAIAPEKRKKTALYLMATAGMRLLTDARREHILKEVSQILRDDKSFDFKFAMVISGAYEGLYGWMAVNYLDDRFAPSEKREGLLEMGGASTQIAFIPSESFEDHKISRTLQNKTYDIYTRSYLYMGVNEARKLTATSNCYPLQFPIDNKGKSGTGNFDRCVTDIVESFSTLCENLECNGPHCIFKNGFSPKVEDTYLALSSFYFTFKFLDLGEQVKPDVLRKKGREFCNTDWETLKTTYPKIPEPFLKSYCFNAAYFWSLLEKGYGFSDSRANIETKGKVKGTEISWTLGALIDMELGHRPEKYDIRKRD